MGLQLDALFAGQRNTSLMGADMLNAGQASDEFDWGAVLANGIRGAAQSAMAASVGGAYASGQLQQPMPGYVPGPGAGQGASQGGLNSLMPLLLIGAVLYMVTR